MLVIATETFYHDGRLVRPNQKIEVSKYVADNLLSGGFVRLMTPPPLNIEADLKKKESSSVSQVEQVSTEPTVKKSRNGKNKNQTADL